MCVFFIRQIKTVFLQFSSRVLDFMKMNLKKINKLMNELKKWCG